MWDGQLEIMARFLSVASMQVDVQGQTTRAHPIREDAQGDHGQRFEESSTRLHYGCGLPIRQGRILFFDPGDERPSQSLWHEAEISTVNTRSS